jgi:hypothetical protein
MKRLQVVLALAVFLLLSARAQAQGTAKWADKYPQTGGTVQTIAVQGTSAVARDWTWSGKAKVVFVQVGGGPEITNLNDLTVDTNNGNWGPKGPVDVPGGSANLTSGTNYNVTVSVQMTKNILTKAWVATDPKQAVAK